MRRPWTKPVNWNGLQSLGGTSVCQRRQECNCVGTRWNGVPIHFCTRNVAWKCGMQTITMKHGCDLTDVLTKRRFALLGKRLLWNRKIQCGNSCRWILTLFGRIAAVLLYIWWGNGVPTPFFSALHPWRRAQGVHCSRTRWVLDRDAETTVGQGGNNGLRTKEI